MTSMMLATVMMMLVVSAVMKIVRSWLKCLMRGLSPVPEKTPEDIGGFLLPNSR